jgi:hypothetical protein
MNAEEARKLTYESMRGPVIEGFILLLNKKILETAKQGKSCIDPWQHISSLRGTFPTTEQQQAIKTHYLNHGYTWGDHDDPDPGHPCSRAYTTLSW